MSNHALLFHVNSVLIRRGVGVYRIATWLRQHDWDVEVVDFTMSWTLAELKEFSKSRITSKTVFVGFSSFFNAWSDTLEHYASWLKTEWPHLKTVLGGQDLMTTPARDIDYWVDGFGENAMLELIKYLTGNGNKITFDPKYLGSKKVIKANQFYPSFPMRSLLIEYEDRDFLIPNEWLGIELGRGCKFKCDFCNFPVLGVKGDYSRDAEDFERELKTTYERYGIKNYYVADETINDRTEKLIKFADVVDRLDFQPFFSGFLRADLMVSRPQDLEHIARMRLFGQFYGIESMNYESAKSIGKGMHPDKLLPGLLDIKKYFKQQGPYRGEISLIVGLPHETKDSTHRGFQWLVDNWQGEAMAVNPLIIPTDNHNPSEFSLKWREKGFKITDRTLDLFPESIRQMFFKWGLDKQLLWSTEHLDIFDAVELCNHWWTNSNKYDFKQGIWNIGNEMLLNGVNFDTAFQISFHQDNQEIKCYNRDKHIKEYKEKKFNYK